MMLNALATDTVQETPAAPRSSPRRVGVRFRDIKGDEETRLILAYQAGDAAAGAVLVKAHTPLIRNHAQRMRKRGLDDDDLFQEACIGFLEGIRRFDPTRGFKSSTYVAWWIRQAIRRAVRDAYALHIPGHVQDVRVKAHVRGLSEEPEALMALGASPKVAEAIAQLPKVISLQAPVPYGEWEGIVEDFVASDDPGPDACSEAADTQVFVRSEVLSVLNRARLNVIEYDIIKRRVLVADGDEVSLKTIADDYGLSRERIRQLEVRAMQKLRLAAQTLLSGSVRRELAEV